MKKVISHPGFWTTLLLLCLLLACTLYRLEELEALQHQPERTISAMTVHGEPAYRGVISAWVSGEGTVSAVRKQNLIFEISGKVNQLGKDTKGHPIREGSHVKGPQNGETGGTCLAALDNRSIKEEITYIRSEQSAAENEVKMAKSALRQSQITLELAKSRYERSKALYGKKSGSLHLLEEAEAAQYNSLAETQAAQARIDAAQARINGLKARLAQTRLSLEKSVLYAPFDGVIARLNIQEGDYYEPSMVDHANGAALQSTAPVTIIDPKEIEVVIDLPVFDGQKVKPGQRALILTGPLDWYTGKNSESTLKNDLNLDYYKLEASVYSVSPVLGLNNRTIRVKIRARQQERQLLHGMFVTCWIETEKKQDALLIPIESLQVRDDAPFVFLNDHGRAKRQPVSLGLTDQDTVEVIDGLSEGEIVITKGKRRLYQDHPVRVIRKQDESNEG